MFTTSSKPHIAVIGGGAAGLMAAGRALEMGADVTIFEHSDRLAKKVGITGKGRCNVTNDCTAEEFLSAVIHNPRFLYAAITRFTPADTVRFFEDGGVPLKTERGRRVFPVSDRALDIVGALKSYAKGAHVCYAHAEELLMRDGAVCGVQASGEAREFDRVILTTGGKSYPGTGSDGSGYALAEALGHTVEPLLPSLVPLTSDDGDCREMMGLSLRNVGVRIERQDGKVLYDDFGELLFTHFGLSGPTVLSASSHLHGYEITELRCVIDLKPALDEQTLNARLLSDFEKYKNRNFQNALSDLLPAKMIPVMIRRSGISPEKKVNEITKAERRQLLACIKHFTVSLSGFRPIAEAIVTAGGVRVKEVNPTTMESRKVKGLFFAGEILDVDAYTGGYNLQIAFSTGRLAGESAAKE